VFCEHTRFPPKPPIAEVQAGSEKRVVVPPPAHPVMEMDSAATLREAANGEMQPVVVELRLNPVIEKVGWTGV